MSEQPETKFEKIWSNGPNLKKWPKAPGPDVAHLTKFSRILFLAAQTHIVMNFRAENFFCGPMWPNQGQIGPQNGPHKKILRTTNFSV